MKRIGWLLFLAVLAVASVAAQTAGKSTDTKPKKINPLEPYAGTWTASLDGKPWMTVQLTLQGEQMAGSVLRAHDLKFNDDGNVKSVSEEQLNEALESAQINNDGLLLTVRDPSAKESDRYLLRLTGDTTAEMRMLAMSMPPGMPKPKPWKLTRTPGTGAPVAR